MLTGELSKHEDQGSGWSGQFAGPGGAEVTPDTAPWSTPGCSTGVGWVLQALEHLARPGRAPLLHRSAGSQR